MNRNWNWDGAGIECRSLHKDARLLVINNAEEQHAITKMLDSVNGQRPFDWLILSPLTEKIPHQNVKLMLNNLNVKFSTLTSRRGAI